MDPGAAYYQVTYTLDFAMFRQLVSWQPDDTDQPTPDLATGEPEISDDNKTITFTIQDGIKYSPPLEDREVTSADIKYAIERTLLPGVPNGYTATYLADVDGMKEAQAAVAKDETTAPDISGIETPDDQTIVFHLNKTSVLGVLGALSLPVSSPVPEEYAKEFDAESPSTYGEHVVFTGPYMVENDSDGRADRLLAGQGDQARPEPELGCRTPTGVPPTWTRSRSRRASPIRPRRRRRSSTAAPRSAGTSHPRRRWSSRSPRATSTTRA